MKIKQGQFVKVYKKPISREDYEGIAKVIRVFDNPQDSQSVYIDALFRDESCTYRRIVALPAEILPSRLAGF